MKSNQSNIKKAKKYLDKNYCIGVPTETVYGLAANAYKNSAVKKIYNLKKRPKNNPLIVHYHDIDSLKKDCLINDNFIKLYKKFSPGPITYVLQLRKNSKISKYVTNNKKSLAVRFPKHTIFKNLLKQLDYPLAAPSANITTKVSAVKAKDVKEEFGNKIKYILSGFNLVTEGIMPKGWVYDKLDWNEIPLDKNDPDVQERLEKGASSKFTKVSQSTSGRLKPMQRTKDTDKMRETLIKLTPPWTTENLRQEMLKVANRTDITDEQKTQLLAQVLNPYIKSVEPLHNYLNQIKSGK